MTFSLPPAVKLAAGLARDIELAVTKFNRAHRYGFGQRLRDISWTVLEVANQAARWPAQRQAHLTRLVHEVEKLKLAMQIGQELRQFASLGQFEALFRSVIQLGQQVGGWHKQAHPKGQDGRAQARGQRAMTMSTRDTSMCEVNA